MNYIVKLSIIVLCCSYVSLSMAAVKESSQVTYDHQQQTVQLNEYFELAGINELLSSIPLQLESMQQDALEQYGKDSDDYRVLTVLIKAWDMPMIQKHLTLSIHKSLTAEQVSALLTWQKSELANDVKRLDESTMAESFEHDFNLFLTQLPKSMPEPNKVEAINHLIDAKQIVESMVDLTMSVSRPVMLALAESSEQPIDIASIEQEMLELESLLSDDLAEQIAVLSYFLYRELSIQEIQAYTQFYQSELGQLELAIFNKALYQSIALWQSYYEDVSYEMLLSQVLFENP